MKPELPHGKQRLILCWEVNNCAVLQSPGNNFNVIFETAVTILTSLIVLEIDLKTHNDGNDMTLQFSHRHYIGCCISKKKKLLFLINLVLLLFATLFFVHGLDVAFS